jgi:cell division septal protein FtsQ
MVKSRYKKASSRISKRQKTRKYAGMFLKITLPVVVLVGFVFLLRAGFLQVKNFEISGAETVPQENIKNAALSFASGTNFFVIPKSNIIIFNKGKLAAALLATFPRIEKVDVAKNFFGQSVELRVTEREADFLWCSIQGECFNMTKDGLVFESYSAEAPRDKIIFEGVLDGNPIMKSFATPAQMQNYLSLVNTFKNAKIVVTDINIELTDKATAKSNIGDIIFDPEGTDLSSVAQNAILLINQVKSKTPSAEFNYIDARFGNKMFYKLI